MRTSRINIDYTINSGQVFLWEKIDRNWYGINGKEIFCVRQNPFKLSSSTKKSSDLFRQTDDVGKILKNISKARPTEEKTLFQIFKAQNAFGNILYC